MGLLSFREFNKIVEIKKINKEMLGRYSEIPISFEVKSILKMDLINNGLDGIKFLEEKVSKPFYMNFDEDGHGPKSWPTRFNIDNWGIFVAIKDEIYVGGMALA